MPTNSQINPYESPAPMQSDGGESTPQKMITVEGQPTFDDYRRAQRFHGLVRTVIVSGVLVAMALFMWVVSQSIVFSSIVVLYVFVMRPFFVRYRLKRQWQQTPSFHQGQRTYGLDEAGFHSRDDEGRPTLLHWSRFLKFRESKDTFLLYLAPNMYLFLPKRFISPQDQDGIRSLLKAKLNRSVQGRN
jgi:hypothetical protein